MSKVTNLDVVADEAIVPDGTRRSLDTLFSAWLSAIESGELLDSWIASRELGTYARPLRERDAAPEMRMLLARLKKVLQTHQEASVRAEAVSVLGLWGHEAALALLLSCLEDKDAAVRMRAVESLGRIGDQAAVSGLAQTLCSDSNLWVRQQAAVALGRIGDLRAVSSLIEALDHDHVLVQAGAVDALGHLPCSATRQALRRSAEGEVAELRWRAARALASVGSARAVPILEALRGDEASLFGYSVDAVAREALERVQERQSDAWRRLYGLRKLVGRTGPAAVTWARRQADRWQKLGDRYGWPSRRVKGFASAVRERGGRLWGAALRGAKEVGKWVGQQFDRLRERMK